MQDEPGTSGPSIGEPAPYFEGLIGEDRITSGDFKGNWLILLSNPEDLLAVFKTRTINYLLCKRRIRVLALVNEKIPSAPKEKNFLKKYIRNHRMTMLDVSEGEFATNYGLLCAPEGKGHKGIFVIDTKGILRMKLYFPPDGERNLYEILKLVDALQSADRQRSEQSKAKSWKRRLEVVIRMKGLAEQE